MASPGRPKGSPNKFSAQAKENVIHVFEHIGGVKKMAKWAEDNLSEFYRLYARLLPTDVQMTVLRDVKEVDDAELANIATAGGDRAAGEASGTEVTPQLH